MVEDCRAFDLGLASEQASTANRALCLSNKAATYPLAGLPVAITETPGQRRLADDLDREESRVGDEGEGEGATTGHDAPDHRVRRRSSRAASRAIIASTSARDFPNAVIIWSAIRL